MFKELPNGWKMSDFDCFYSCHFHDQQTKNKKQKIIIIIRDDISMKKSWNINLINISNVLYWMVYVYLFWKSPKSDRKENLGQGIQKFQSNPTLLKP